ncbi:MAG: IS200/IS605 family transposase [Acidobacteriia bacterium]|nr:IS200/IS605 family transposase [Terriglobia bacterium]
MASHAFSEIYLHITWHTKDNAPVITKLIEEPLYQYLQSRATETQSVEVHSIGGIEDHVHLVVRVPPTLLISEWIGQLKGASSHEINKRVKRSLLHWQEGYGVVSFGKPALMKVVSYVQNQREHHGRGTLCPALERVDEEE